MRAPPRPLHHLLSWESRCWQAASCRPCGVSGVQAGVPLWGLGTSACAEATSDILHIPRPRLVMSRQPSRVSVVGSGGNVHEHVACNICNAAQRLVLWAQGV